MTFEIMFVLLVTVLALILFAMGRLRLDQVSLTIPVLLLLGGILTPREALSGLSNEATVAVAAMLVLGLGLRKTGLVAAIGRWAQTAPLGSDTMRVFVLCVIVAVLSPFLNNTAVVMVFLPVFVALADRAGEPPSLYLMPLSFVAILGGTVSLIGTSTNLIVHGMAVERGYGDLSMFSIAPLGIIYLVVGFAYLFTIGRTQLPRRERPPDLSRKYDMRRFLTELEVPVASPANGRSLGELKWRERYAVSVLGIKRGSQDIPSLRAATKIEEGDILYVQGAADRLLVFARQQTLGTPTDRTSATRGFAAGAGRLVEVLIAPGSPLQGRTLRNHGFAQRYDATVLAIQQHGVMVHERLADVEFKVGDLLLVHGMSSALERLADEPGFIPMGEVKAPLQKRPRAVVAGGIMVLVVAAAGTGLFDIVTAALAGVTLMVFTGCIRIDEIYAELDWLVVFVMAGLLPLGLALDKTGAASLLASGILEVSGGWGATGLTAAFYLVATLLTAVISNAAAATLLSPIAILAAIEAGINPYALLVSVMFGASASFITPFGYKTNIMIYQPGGYRFSDFAKVGGLLNLILLVTAIIFIPILWPS